jgi:hypothetical protein
MLAIGLIIIRDETYSLHFYSIIQFVHALEPTPFSFIFAFIIGEQHYSDHFINSENCALFHHLENFPTELYTAPCGNLGGNRSNT